MLIAESFGRSLKMHVNPAASFETITTRKSTVIIRFWIAAHRIALTYSQQAARAEQQNCHKDAFHGCGDLSIGLFESARRLFPGGSNSNSSPGESQ